MRRTFIGSWIWVFGHQGVALYEIIILNKMKAVVTSGHPG